MVASLWFGHRDAVGHGRFQRRGCRGGGQVCVLCTHACIAHTHTFIVRVVPACRLIAENLITEIVNLGLINLFLCLPSVTFQVDAGTLTPVTSETSLKHGRHSVCVDFSPTNCLNQVSLKFKGIFGGLGAAKSLGPLQLVWLVVKLGIILLRVF